jgi:hypothetical protein
MRVRRQLPLQLSWNLLRFLAPRSSERRFREVS